MLTTQIIHQYKQPTKLPCHSLLFVCTPLEPLLPQNPIKQDWQSCIKAYTHASPMMGYLRLNILEKNKVKNALTANYSLPNKLATYGSDVLDILLVFIYVKVVSPVSLHW